MELLWRTAHIRQALVDEYQRDPFQPMVEIKGASFLADAPAIIGAPNLKYIKAELEWYESMSLNIADISGGAPKMWRRAANEEGWVNSNYGWVLWSQENGSQFDRVTAELRRDFASRRALVIYTRPSMHVDQYLGGGGQDFMCTNAVAYSINPRSRELETVVQMRSNDVVFGYRNDWAWQQHAAECILEDLRHDWPDLKMGGMIWQAQSLHVYPRHYGLLRTSANSSEAERIIDGAV